MRALVVYESMFGCTEAIARSIAESMAGDFEAEAVNVDLAPHDLTGVDLLVVGGPTHVHGMSRPSTRHGAAEQSAEGTRSGGGIREWIDALIAAPPGLHVAAFDTRVDKPRWLTGSAARGAERLLRQHSFRPIANPESFFVTTGTPPELVTDEETRARAWGRSLAATLIAVA